MPVPADDPNALPDERPANKLEGSRSPYLAAHAHDAVKWRPWGAAAFKRAQRLERPLLISVGYQSCHWCHVMQRESFQDADLGGFINRHFVPVKVDRELRPDIDALYMSHLTATTGSGGWPMTVFATPEGLPFYSGTYFPRASAGPGSPGFADVLDLVLRAWMLERDRTRSTADEAFGFLRDSFESAGTGFTRAIIDAAATQLRTLEDPVNGGIGSAPKFPQAPACTFLLEYHRLTGESWPVEMTGRWIRAMIRGGIFDSVGGGLFRYSTDATWTLPHFEKMLYDQGLLLSTLASLNAVAPDAELRRAALRTAEFLARDLARPGGGFNSSLDAETGGVEGATYVWSREQLEAVLSAEEIEVAERHLGVASANASTQTSGNDETVITRRAGCADDAPAVDGVIGRLAEARAARPQPAVIDNVIVSWNAMAARGLIEAGASFDLPDLTQAGLATLKTLLADAQKSDSILSALDDPSATRVHLLESSAAVCAACLSAVQHASRTDLLKTAVKLHTAARKRFRAADGRMLVSSGDARLPLVPTDQADAPTPSGAAIFAENAVRLAALTERHEYLDDARTTLRQFERAAVAVPALAGHALAVASMLERDRT